MGLKFRYNDKTYSLVEEFSVNGLTSSNNLVYEFNTGSSSTAKKYIPAFETRGSKLNIGNSGTTRRYVDNSAPTICFRKNNKTYYCAKSLKYVSQHTVSYSSNGGSGSMDSQTFYPDDGESVTIKANGFTRSGYSFVSWNTSPDGSGTAYSPGAKFSGNGLSLYAQWESNGNSIPAGTYTPASFEELVKKFISANGGRAISNSTSVTVNSQTVTLSPGSYIYYTVDGTSPRGYIRCVGFGVSTIPEIANNYYLSGFSQGKKYVTYMQTDSGFEFVTLGFSAYANVKITVNSPIVFK